MAQQNNRVLIVSFNVAELSVAAHKNFLDFLKNKIPNNGWAQAMPGMMLIVTDMAVQKLSPILHELAPRMAFTIFEIDKKSGFSGYMPPKALEWLNSVFHPEKVKKADPNIW